MTAAAERPGVRDLSGEREGETQSRGNSGGVRTWRSCRVIACHEQQPLLVKLETRTGYGSVTEDDSYLDAVRSCGAGEAEEWAGQEEV